MLQMGLDCRKYAFGLDCARRIVKDEGWRGLWKGAGTNVLRSFVGAAAMCAYAEATAEMIVPDYRPLVAWPPGWNPSTQSFTADTGFDEKGRLKQSQDYRTAPVAARAS